MVTMGRCMKCQEQVEIKEPKESEMANGRKIAKGKCANGCGTTVCRIGGIQDDAVAGKISPDTQKKAA